MRQYVFIVVLGCVYKVNSDCLDINGKSIAQGFHYVPGPDACTLCICENEHPKLCKAVLCSSPPECQYFTRVGKSCCSFQCLDGAGTDLGLRLLVSVVAAILSLSLLLFLVHRLKQRKTIGRQSRALRGDQRGGIGYITGSLGYMPENYFTGADGFDRHIEFRYEEAPSHLSLWKPPGPGHGPSFYPRGEAPPPYDEAVGHTRAELTITASRTLPNISHRTIPLNLTAPGTIHIIHPHSRHGHDNGLTTISRNSNKLRDGPAGTLQINISGCGFHALQSSDGAAQVPTPPEIDEGGALSSNSLYAAESEFPPHSEIAKPQELAKGEDLGKLNSSRTESPNLGTDDHDDYHSECENCKSSPSGGPTYYPDEEPEPPETMTLQRMPRETEEEPYYRTSLTLPTHCRKPRRVLGSREGWFSSMPESSSEDEE